MLSRWFDAHLDLAYLAECGRDMHVDPAVARGRHQPAAVTLPSLADGGVRAVLATIFTEAQVESGTAPTQDVESGAHAYPEGDADAANMAGRRQLKLYHAWQDAGLIQLMRPRVGDSPTQVDSQAPVSSAQASATSTPLLCGILLECADPIIHPDDLAWWADQGVVAIGMAWWHQSRYAGGNGVKSGLTDLGRDLVARMDARGVVHDASHLSDRSLAELFELTDAPVMASHSNCRSLLHGDARTRSDDLSAQRHLSDESIKEIARRGGVIGLNLVRNFIKPGIDSKDPTDRPSVDDAIAHVEHICEVVGDRAHVGLGSDMDGGITANDLPAGVNRPKDLRLLADALAHRGWADADIEAFAWGNWARFWRLNGVT